MSFKGSNNGPSETSVADVIELKSGRKLNRETPPTTKEAEELAKETRLKAAIAAADEAVAEGDEIEARIESKLNLVDRHLRDKMREEV